MHHFLDTLVIPQLLMVETDNSVSDFISLLNEAISWINNYQFIAKNQQLTLLKTLLENIDETNSRFTIFRQELNKIVKDQLKKQKRKEKLIENNTSGQFDSLIAEDLCAVYNGIRSIEYMLINLVKYLKKNSAEQAALANFLSEFLNQVTETKQLALNNMKQRLQIYSEQEEISRRAEAQSHTVLQNSTIGSMVDISNISSSSVNIDSHGNIKADSLIGSFTQLPLPLEQSFQYVHSVIFAPNGDILDLSKSQQDTSINKFMMVDVFIYPCFPLKEIGSQLNVTVYDYFRNQTEDTNNSDTQEEIVIINKAFLLEKKAQPWLSYFTGLFKLISKPEIFAEEILPMSVNAKNSRIQSEPEESAVLSDSDFYPIKKLAGMVTATIKGIENYLDLNGKHLSFWTRLFDGDRGYKRAKQYQALFKQLEQHPDEHEKYNMQMALLTVLMLSRDGKTLKNEIVTQINCQEVFMQKTNSLETATNFFRSAPNYKLDDIKQAVVNETKAILSNDADKIKEFNSKFIKPFVAHINNKKAVPATVFEVLGKLLQLDSSILIVKNQQQPRIS